METQKWEKELLPGEVEPPKALASRTCTKIWETLDSEHRAFTPNSGTFLDSAFFSPESVLPSSFLLQTSEPYTSKLEERQRELPKTGKKIETKIEEDDEPPPRSSHWIGLVASVSVGMVIAVFLFPMLELVKRSTRSYVTESWMSEINRRVDQYEQIHGSQNSLQGEILQPLNLALSGWQELHSEVLAPSLLPPAMLWFTMEPPNHRVGRDFLFPGGTLAVFGKGLPDIQVMNETLQELQSFPWAALKGVDDPIPLETNGLSEHLLLSIPKNGTGESSARSAHGQDVLIKDGRIFFRVLPNTE